MDCGTICPICFSEYTTAGNHRIISLQCGHLFGSQCIEKWLDKKRKVQCPTCSMGSTRKQLRIIYASKVIALNTDNEQRLIEKCLKEEKEKNEYIEINDNLRNQIECLKSELESMNERRKNEKPRFNIHKVQKTIINIDFDSNNSIIDYDEINNFIIVTCRKGNTVGIQKFGYNDFNVVEFVNLGENETFIKDIVMSSFGDGLILIPIGNTINLINMYNNDIIMKYTIPNQISSVYFDEVDRNLIYCGDDKGSFYYINIKEESLKVSKMSNIPIHSICKKDLMIFVSTIYQSYKITFLGDYIINPLEFGSNSICTNMSIHDGNILFTFRDSSFKVKHFIYGKKEMYFNTGIKQTKRHKDRIYKDYIYIIDDESYSLKILNIQTFVIIYSYTFKERVIDFSVRELLLLILTKHFIYVFSNT